MADYNINAVTRRVVFTGSAGLGPYAFTFEILDDDDLAVYFNTTKLTKTTDYTVTINANGTGSVSVIVNVSGNIPATPDANDTIIILGARDIERVTDFVTAGDLLASSLNQQLDSLTIFDQQVAEEQKRSLQAPVFDPAHVDDGGTLDMTLPAKASRLNKVLQFNATTGNPEAGPTADEISNAQTYANNASASATAAASSATSASGSATTATTKAAEASTSAAAAAASQTASAASETASAASETASAASEAAAASSASSASTSAATATTKAAEAATSAGNASTSETNAASSATAAASSATAAAASQTAAAASAASAASAFDNFDDTYLGSKTSDPTTDNDGDALTQGDLYFNSTANEMRVYDGANWIAATSAGGVSLILYEYTATSGQTTFSGADDNAATLSYTADNIQVFMNGVNLDPSDYTATNGTSVVLASGAAANDIVNIYAFKSFTTADMVSASAGGTFSGNVAVNARLDVDNIRIDGNTISSTDTNGDITLDPNGTGDVVVTSAEASSTADLTVQNTNASGQGAVLRVKAANTNANSKMVFDDGGTESGFVFDGGANAVQHFVNGSERLRITSDGDVGIGCTPSSIFHTEENTTGASIVRHKNTSNTSGAHSRLIIQNGGSSGGDALINLDAQASGSQFTLGVDRTLRYFFICNADKGSFDGSDQAFAVAHSGDVFVGTTTTIGPAQLNIDGASQCGIGIRAGNGTSGYFNQVVFANNGNTALIGSIQRVNDASVQYNTTSDARLKENIADMTGAITRVKQLAPKRYSWVNEDLDAADQDGFLAHEAQTVVPMAVSGTQDEVDGDGNPVYMQMDYSKLVPLLTGALKEAIAKIETLETKVAALEAAE